VHRLRLVNVSSRFFDPYTFPLGRVSHISSIRTLPNTSTRTSKDCATPSLTALGLRRTLGFFVSCMCVSCSTTHGLKWLMIFLFACPRVLLMTSVPCYVFTSGNLSYKFDNSDFPSDSREKRGHFIGISESVGHAMTFKILTDNTLKVIHWSNVRLALNPHA
jgi:hypothetical protein